MKRNYICLKLNPKSSMEDLVRELYENFLMSEACSKYYAIAGQESEAQDVMLYIRYMDHANLCKNAAKACSEYLKTKNEYLLFKKLKVLGLDNILY